MKRAFKMEYLHPTGERSSIKMIPYTSQFREQYKAIYNDCYHEMREALKIEPYDFIQDDSFFEKGMDSVYLLVDGQEMIGSVALNGNEIDDLIVSRSYQHRGYGRDTLLWALEHIGSDSAILHVAEWNKRAIDLYKNTGFEITETIVIG